MNGREESKPEFEHLLKEPVQSYGNLCSGQVLGDRMSMEGLRDIAIRDTKCRRQKDFMVIVGTDRCVLDAVQSVSGCSKGIRTLKLMDYGKMAATFVNLKTGQSVRVVTRDDSRERAKGYAPDTADIYAVQYKAYKMVADEDLLKLRTSKFCSNQRICPADRLGGSTAMTA